MLYVISVIVLVQEKAASLELANVVGKRPAKEQPNGAKIEQGD